MNQYTGVTQEEAHSNKEQMHSNKVKAVVCTLATVLALVLGAMAARVHAQTPLNKSKTLSAISFAQVHGSFDRFAKSNFKCITGHCDEFVLWKWRNAFGKTKSSSDCMNKILSKRNPRLTGAVWDTWSHECSAHYDGFCNIFADNGFHWHSAVSAQKTCTVVVTDVNQGWIFQTCTQHQKQKLTYTSGMTHASSISGNSGISLENVVEIGVSASVARETSTQISQEIPLEVAEGEQKCVWAWSYDITHLAGNGNAVVTTAHYVVTPSPDHKPQCFPNRFDLSDTNFQTCTQPEYRITEK